jgi:hypothetical protein
MFLLAAVHSVQGAHGRSPGGQSDELNILQAIHSRDLQQLQQCLEDWQATTEALATDALMDALQQPYDPGDYVSWEHVRGEVNRPVSVSIKPQHLAQPNYGKYPSLT